MTSDRRVRAASVLSGVGQVHHNVTMKESNCHPLHNPRFDTCPKQIPSESYEQSEKCDMDL